MKRIEPVNPDDFIGEHFHRLHEAMLEHFNEAIAAVNETLVARGAEAARDATREERVQKTEAELAISKAKHKQLVDSMREVLRPEDGESLAEAAERLRTTSDLMLQHHKERDLALIAVERVKSDLAEWFDWALQFDFCQDGMSGDKLRETISGAIALTTHTAHANGAGLAAWREWVLRVADIGECETEELRSYIEECVNAFRRKSDDPASMRNAAHHWREQALRWEARVLELERRREVIRKALDGGVK